METNLSEEGEAVVVWSRGLHYGDILTEIRSEGVCFKHSLHTPELEAMNNFSKVWGERRTLGSQNTIKLILLQMKRLRSSCKHDQKKKNPISGEPGLQCRST